MNQTVSHRHYDGFELRVCAEFREQALDIAAAGVQRDAELTGDDVGLEPGGEHVQNVALPVRERRQRLAADIATDERFEQTRMDYEAASAGGPQRVQHLRQ